MYVRYDGTIINLDNISYIKVCEQQADFYGLNGLLLNTIPLQGKQEAIEVIEKAMSYTGLIQAIDRLNDSFENVANAFESISEITSKSIDKLGENRLDYVNLINGTMKEWANMFGIDKKINYINDKKE